MDKKVELQVLNITNSQAQVGAFALLLGEVNGERQLPIIIGPAEAQATALYMKGVKTPRPLTHDLFMTIIGVLGASLLRVLIYKAKDGIFYSYIYLKKDEEIIRIDTRTSDAVGMAIRAECPILIYESILEQECLRISNEERRHPEESDEEAEDEKKRDLPRNVTSMSLEEALEKRCLVAIKETIFQEPLWPCHLHIAMAPTKNMDRNEWLAEKATEIGFDELTFLNCRFSERKVIKTERIEKILISAIKQSLKARLPKLNEMTDFDKFIAQEFQGQKFIAHCYEGEKPQLKNVLKAGEDALVLIGPEGDFSEEEVKKAIECGFTPISLGKSRLRTETAALVACHTMNLLNQ